MLQTRVFRRARCVEQRSVSFAQRDRLQVIALERQQLAVTPYAALIENFIRRAPFPPDLLPLLGVGPAIPKRHLQQSAALQAVVDRLVNRKVSLALPLKAGQLG